MEVAERSKETLLTGNVHGRSARGKEGARQNEEARKELGHGGGSIPRQTPKQLLILDPTKKARLNMSQE